MENQRIAIIGAGISGLVSAKYAKEKGLNPIIFDKNTTIGGVWSQDGQAWPNLETNVSKYNVQFSDHFWKDDDPIFIPKDRLYTWLLEYVEKFKLTDCLKFNTKVMSISKDLENFQITYEKDGVVCGEVFPYVIIATGFFCRPDFIGLDQFMNSGIKIEHSCSYKYPESYKGKKVICIGFSHSSLQIAEAVGKHAEKLYSLFRRPNFIVPKLFYSNVFKKVIFNDLISFGSRESVISLNNLSQAEINKQSNNFRSALSNQNKIESLKVEYDCEESLSSGVCKDYIKMIEEGKIEPIKAEITAITDEGIQLTNGQIIQADNIILGTGFKSDLSFIDEFILKELEYNPIKDSLNLDGLNVFNCNIKGLAFVGFQYSSTFTTFELQARLAISYFLNQYSPKELKLKPNANYKACYNNYILRLAEQLEAEPNIEVIKRVDPELYDYLMNGPILPQHFRLNPANPEEYQFNSEIIKKWNRMFKDENVKFFS
jgi:dimethylaniline monooxygenase (N-oxide forming)